MKFVMAKTLAILALVYLHSGIVSVGEVMSREFESR
jgi:hypothetical protein